MRILAFLLARIAQMALIALLLAFAAFWLASMVPGDFFSIHLADFSANAESIHQLRRQYGLDQPVYVQYWQWLQTLLRQDLGYSLFYQRPVLPVVAEALCHTLWMGLPALLLGFGAGILMGTLRSILTGRALGWLLDLFASIALSLPSLLLGMCALLLAAHTGWFPLGGINSPEYLDSGLWPWMIDRLHHLILPVLCLALPVLAYVERIQYAAAHGNLRTDALRSAQARGLGRMHIFIQYILRPSLNPVISVSGPILGAVLSGSLILEVIFSWPGLGRVTYDALFNSDLYLLAGCILGSSMLLVGGNLLADIILMALDPRTRTYAAKGVQ